MARVIGSGVRWGLLVAIVGLVVLLGAPVVHHAPATQCMDRTIPVLRTILGPPLAAPPSKVPGVTMRVCEDVEAHRSSVLQLARDDSPIAWGRTLGVAIPVVLLMAGMVGVATLGEGGAAPRRHRREWTAGRVAFALLATLPAIATLYSAGDLHELLGRPNDDDVTYVVVPLFPFAVVDDLVQEAILTALDAAGPSYLLEPDWWATGGRGLHSERAKIVPTYAGPLGTTLTVLACFLLWVAVQPHLMRGVRAIRSRGRRGPAAS